MPAKKKEKESVSDELAEPQRLVDELLRQQTPPEAEPSAPPETAQEVVPPRRRFLRGIGLVGLAGVAGLAGAVGHRYGQSYGPAILFGEKVLELRAASYVLFRDATKVYAVNGQKGSIEFEGTPSAVLEALAVALRPSGGTVAVRSGEYTLESQFPPSSATSLRLIGEGRSTRFLNGGQSFDALDVDSLEVSECIYQDMNGVLCYSGLTSAMLSRGLQSLGFTQRGAEALTGVEVKHLGDYVRVRTTQTGFYPALSTGQAVQNRMDAKRSLRLKATVRLEPPTQGAFTLFAEPFKGDFDNFLGFRWRPPGSLDLLTRKDGSETLSVHPLSVAEMTGDHVYEIAYTTDRVSFYRDGLLLGEHTDNISAPPHEWSAAEPNGTVLSCYLKHPYFEVVTL